MWDDSSWALERRYQRFCLARAQRLFTIRASFHAGFFSSGTHEVWLCPKEEDDLPQGYRWFPPAFFALPLSTEDKYLTISNPGRRHWINSAHPLAQFLLQNTDVLRDRTPGILMEFTRCLAEDNGDDLVNTVKDLIERLRSLSKDPKTPWRCPPASRSSTPTCVKTQHGPDSVQGDSPALAIPIAVTRPLLYLHDVCA